MSSTNFNGLKICPLQIELKSGDIVFNTHKIIDYVSNIDADIFITPELALNGGCADKILDVTAYQQQITQAITQICAKVPNKVVVFSCDRLIYPNDLDDDGVLYEKSILWLENGSYRLLGDNFDLSSELPFHQINYQGHKIVFILEDTFELFDHDNLAEFDLAICLSTNAFFAEQDNCFKEHLAELALSSATKIIWVNNIGADDYQVFAGASCAFNTQGEVIYQAPYLIETPFVTQPNLQNINWNNSPITPNQNNDLDLLYNALVIATHAYVQKYNFKGVVLGLSGGVDSALTLAIAVDALGKDKVTAVMLPYLYTSDASIADATDQANNLGVKFEVVPIEPVMQAFQSTLAPLFADFPADVTEENLQARTRAVILMAIANKKGLLLLNTGNKSELATGYCTLYGDMAGGFAPLKDVLKTQVFQLAKYYNFVSKKNVIPKRVITRAPSAELAPNQYDQDILPPYAELDKILRYILNGGVIDEARLTAQGFNVNLTYKILNMITKSKFKREQAAVGPFFSNCTLNGL